MFHEEKEENLAKDVVLDVTRVLSRNFNFFSNRFWSTSVASNIHFSYLVRRISLEILKCEFWKT
eukprot:UN00273